MADGGHNVIESAGSSKDAAPADEERLTLMGEVPSQLAESNQKKLEEFKVAVSDEPEDPIVDLSPVTSFLHQISPLQIFVYLRLTLEHHYRRHRKTLVRLVLSTLCLGYFLYLGVAVKFSFGDEPSIRLVVLTLLCVIGVLYYLLKKSYGNVIYTKHILPIIRRLRRWHSLLKIAGTVVVTLTVVLFIIVDTSMRRPRNLVSAVGLLVFTLVMFFFSKDPRQVVWRPVLWGLLLQLIFGVFVLRTQFGYNVFDWLGKRVTEYLDHSNAGAEFIFGKDFRDHFFAFQFYGPSTVLQPYKPMILGRESEAMEEPASEPGIVLWRIIPDGGEQFNKPAVGQQVYSRSVSFSDADRRRARIEPAEVMPVLVFFSASIGVLYYLGVIQVLIEKIAFIMQNSLGTGAMESLHAAVNIFVGWGEAITIVRPLLDKMTMSELHTVMTNGFATVAGSTLAIYILFGASANHLLSASVMSAPAALAMSKLFYPETKENRKKVCKACKVPTMGSGLIDAASIGAVGAISIVAHILVSVIAFISLLAFVNATLQWFGERVGLMPPDYPFLSFELICSYLFWPLVFLMGVDPVDCRVVARMVGIKTFINEFIAYQDLGQVVRNRVEYAKWNGTWVMAGNSDLILEGTNITLKGGVISPHSEMIATFALCGFSNVVALGIMIGALTAVAPSRKDDITAVSIRALLSGCMACFMTASIAGLLGDA